MQNPVVTVPQVCNHHIEILVDSHGSTESPFFHRTVWVKRPRPFWPPIFWYFIKYIPPIHGDLGDGLLWFSLFLLYHVLPTLYYVIPKNKQLPYGDDIHHWLSLMTDSPWGFRHGFPTKSVPIRSISRQSWMLGQRAFSRAIASNKWPCTSFWFIKECPRIPWLEALRLARIGRTACSSAGVETPGRFRNCKIAWSVGDLRPICWICWDGKPELERKDTAKENCRKELDGKLQKNHTSKKMKPARRLLLGSQLSLICPLGNLHNGPEASFLRDPSDDRRRIESWGKQTLRRSHPSFREGGHDNLLIMPKRLNPNPGRFTKTLRPKFSPESTRCLALLLPWGLGRLGSWSMDVPPTHRPHRQTDADPIGT